MRVYRVEHARKKALLEGQLKHYSGAYRDRDHVLDHDEQEHICRLPTPWCGNWWDGDYTTIFAFQSMDALLKWIPQEILHKYTMKGYVVAVYEVDEYYLQFDRHGYQCAFRPCNATKVKRKLARTPEILEQLAA